MTDHDLYDLTDRELLEQAGPGAALTAMRDVDIPVTCKTCGVRFARHHPTWLSLCHLCWTERCSG